MNIKKERKVYAKRCPPDKHDFEMATGYGTKSEFLIVIYCRKCGKVIKK